MKANPTLRMAVLGLPAVAADAAACEILGLLTLPAAKIRLVQVAAYMGTGSIHDAANFVCRQP